MNRRAKDGRWLKSLIKMARPICIRAEKDCPSIGPGRKPEIPDWVVAVLITVAIAKKKKTKSAQYRYLWEHRNDLRNSAV